MVESPGMLPNRFVALAFLLALQASALSAQTAAPDPLVTRPADTPGPGGVQVFFGASYGHDTRVSPLLPGEAGRLLVGPILALDWGIGERGEVSVQWAAHQEFDSGGESTSGVGDPYLWTKVLLRKAHQRGPTVAFRFGFKVPSAPDDKGLGTDEADVFGGLILQQRAGASLVLLNLGLGVLGDPSRNGEQVDVATYGLAVDVPIGSSASFLAEMAGAWDPSSAGTSGSWGEGRLGLRRTLGPGSLGFAIRFGYEGPAPDWGVHVGYTWKIRS